MSRPVRLRMIAGPRMLFADDFALELLDVDVYGGWYINFLKPITRIDQA
jgi:hypothetical protein